MPLTIVHGMELIPNTCLLCNCNPVDGDGNQRRAIFAEGVDVDWGNSVYICEECAELIADLMGRSTREGFDKVTQKLEALQEEHDSLLERYEQEHALLEKIRAGNEAVKRVKAA